MRNAREWSVARSLFVLILLCLSVSVCASMFFLDSTANTPPPDWFNWVSMRSYAPNAIDVVSFFSCFFLLFHLFHSFCCLFICWPIFSSSWCEYVSLIHSISRSLSTSMGDDDDFAKNFTRTQNQWKKNTQRRIVGVFCLLIWCVCVRANKVKRRKRRRRRRKRKENKNRELSTHRVVEALFSGNTIKRQWRRQRQRQHETKFFHREYAKKILFYGSRVCLSESLFTSLSLSVCVCIVLHVYKCNTEKMYL